MFRDLRKLLSLLPNDERGGEVVEWALVSGLLLAAVIVAVGSLAGKLIDRWSAADTGL